MEKGSSSSSSSAAGGGPPDGLKFGKKIYFEGGPAKKVRTGFAQGGQPPRCQVEGCEVDLSGVKAYYSRHKVCGVHSKSSKVIVAGLEQRFCQQCSRFHQLTEFDQGKRSCRRRLAGHNERRRKPQQGSLLSPRYGTLCPSLFDNNHTKTGGFVMDFSAYPPLTGRDLFPNSTSERGSTTTQAVITGKFQLPWQSSSQNPQSDLLQGPTGRALSLLSNQPWPAPKGRLGVNNGFLGQPSDNPVGQFVCSPWSFKGDGENTTLHEMPPDLGLGQTSQPANNGQYNGELGLGQPSEGQFNELDQSRGYDSSVQHMHWSL